MDAVLLPHAQEKAYFDIGRHYTYPKLCMAYSRLGLSTKLDEIMDGLGMAPAAVEGGMHPSPSTVDLAGAMPAVAGPQTPWAR
jgi:hypothetical protein